MNLVCYFLYHNWEYSKQYIRKDLHMKVSTDMIIQRRLYGTSKDSLVDCRFCSKCSLKQYHYYHKWRDTVLNIIEKRDGLLENILK